ncbi:fumarylacetoacetate hydrolase family protein [Embleya sp. NPDC050154]|uniref:fumarylacetoacetate hydrolase family protein n=1 Tax=unclassified Embleya TaxID=2699296 RepID=UPI0037878020
MSIVGVRHPNGAVDVGRLGEDGATVTVLASLEEFWRAPGRYLASPTPDDAVASTDLELVPPVLPGARVFCVGLNYREHVEEGSYRDAESPRHPTLFGRWPDTLSVSGKDVPVPTGEDGLDWEGEVVAWIGSTLTDSTPDAALAAVVGYSTFNDITARRAQKLTSQWTLGKNADASGPLGPLVPAADVGDLRDGLRVRTRVNGEVVQDGSTDQMIFTVGDTLAHISRTTTLRPGDLLATGTPSGVGYARTPVWLLRPGDIVEVEVEKLGRIRNRIVGSEARRHPTGPSGTV